MSGQRNSSFIAVSALTQTDHVIEGAFPILWKGPHHQLILNYFTFW